jgi:phosphate transport system protein
MQQTRKRFHDELASLEHEVETTGEIARVAVARAVDALVRRDAPLARDVVRADDEIDDRYLGIERRILDLLALQTPVASDLRLVSAILHINLHVERVGDMAVNIAKIGLATKDLPADPTILSHIQEMADVVGRMLHTAMDAFVRRDLGLSLQLQAMDDPVDALNRGMYRQVVALASRPPCLEWGIRMNVVARQLERVGDHAVDIGEQVGFLLTGEFHEFTDASHPTPASER